MKGIEKFYDEDDPLKSGSPDKDLLAQVMTRANEDVQPTPEEVHCIMCGIMCGKSFCILD